LKQNGEFSDSCLQRCPFGVLLLDPAGKIQQINPALEAMLNTPAEQLLGHTRETLPFATHRGVLEGNNIVHLAGPGVAQERWLQCEVMESSSGSSRFFVDITELVRLQQENSRLEAELDELAITDDLTGLANQRALKRALDTQVTRSRRYHNPLSLAIIELLDESSPSLVPDDEVVLATSRYLRDRLRWVDFIARWDQNHFLIILPETSAREGERMIDKIRGNFPDIELPESASIHTLSLRFGLAEWQQGDDERRLMDRAAEDLNRDPLIGMAASAS
jgi:diguanylate cyclase (GGDEF)-like protein